MVAEFALYASNIPANPPASYIFFQFRPVCEQSEVAVRPDVPGGQGRGAPVARNADHGEPKGLAVVESFLVGCGKKAVLCLSSNGVCRIGVNIAYELKVRTIIDEIICPVCGKVSRSNRGISVPDGLGSGCIDVECRVGCRIRDCEAHRDACPCCENKARTVDRFSRCFRRCGTGSIVYDVR